MSPLTAEEKKKIIEEEAIRAEARLRFDQVTSKHAQNVPSKMSSKEKRNIIGLILGMVALILVLTYWYLALPVVLLALLWSWKRITISKNHKIYATAVIVIIFIAINGSIAYENRPPTLEVLEPVDNASIEGGKVIVEGKVSPASSVLTIGTRGSNVEIPHNELFETTVNIPAEQNAITITAKNGKKEKTISLTVNRIFTEEEKKEKERQKAEAEAMKPLQEYIAQIKDINSVLTKSFSTIGSITTGKSDLTTWTQDEVNRIAGMSVVIEKSYEIARDMDVPAQYKQFHTIWLQALKKDADAMPLMRAAFDENSPAKLNRATQLVLQGQALLEKSTQEFEKVGK